MNSKRVLSRLFSSFGVAINNEGSSPTIYYVTSETLLFLGIIGTACYYLTAPINDSEDTTRKHIKDTETRISNHVKDAEIRTSNVIKQSEARINTIINEILVDIKKEIRDSEARNSNQMKDSEARMRDGITALETKASELRIIQKTDDVNPEKK